MKLTKQQILHVRKLQDLIAQSQSELARFLAYVVAENDGDPSKHYVLNDAELIALENQPVKLQ